MSVNFIFLQCYIINSFKVDIASLSSHRPSSPFQLYQPCNYKLFTLREYQSYHCLSSLCLSYKGRQFFSSLRLITESSCKFLCFLRRMPDYGTNVVITFALNFNFIAFTTMVYFCYCSFLFRRFYSIL